MLLVEHVRLQQLEQAHHLGVQVQVVARPELPEIQIGPAGKGRGQQGQLSQGQNRMDGGHFSGAQLEIARLGAPGFLAGRRREARQEGVAHAVEDRAPPVGDARAADHLFRLVGAQVADDLGHLHVQLEEELVGHVRVHAAKLTRGHDGVAERGFAGKVGFV